MFSVVSFAETGVKLAVCTVTAPVTPVPAVAYGYDTATGLPITATTGTGPDIQTLTTGYDRLGETTSYTDATGNTSSTSYDLAGNVTSVNDGKGTTTYTIDSSTEHRGLVTSEDIGVAGAPSTFTANYDPDGNLTSETYPNGLVATTALDNAGDETQLQYAKSGSTWMTFTQAFNTDGQIATQSSPQSSQVFTYDPDDRLTTVQDTVDQTGGGTSCTTRTYSFDSDSNRTALKSYPAGSGGACSTSTTPASTAYSYDQADRLTTDTAGSYTYDALGRTATIPSGDAQGIGTHASTTGDLTVGYNVNDMVSTETQGSTTETFSLDPDQNRINTQTDGTTTITNHYSDDSDEPAWAGSGSEVWSRNLLNPQGNLVATAAQDGSVTLELSDPEGNIVADAPDNPSSSAPDEYDEQTEYGVPRSAGGATKTFGWLGVTERSSNDLAGIVLMGLRLYDPQTGRFESTDPDPIGNANAYVYDDPVDGQDTTGESWIYKYSFKWKYAHAIERGHQFERWGAAIAAGGRIGEVGAEDLAEVYPVLGGVLEVFGESVDWVGDRLYDFGKDILEAAKESRECHGRGQVGVEGWFGVGWNSWHFWEFGIHFDVQPR